MKSDNPRTHFYQCRLSYAEAMAIESALAVTGKSRSEWMREAMLRAARETVEVAA